MKKIINGLAAIAAAAIIALPACSTKSSDAAATDADTVAVVETVTEVTEAVTDDPVVELPAGTAKLDAYKGRLTVIDFNADWCGPCRQYGPTFHAVAAKKAGEAAFLSVNVDSCPDVAKPYLGQFIPQTTIIRANGEYVSKTGQLTEEQLTAFIDSVAAL